MSNYEDHWDLKTIPEPEFASEHGRRVRAKGPKVTHEKLEDCPGCGMQLNATQRRRACMWCGRKPSKRGVCR